MRTLSYLVGPELYWAAVCAGVHLATQRYKPPTEAVCGFLDSLWAWLPFVVVPLTFASFLVGGPGRWWLLLRIDLAILVGLVLATTLFANGMVYHKPSSGPGAGAAYIAILIFGVVMAMLGTAVSVGVLWWRSRHA